MQTEGPDAGFGPKTAAKKSGSTFRRRTDPRLIDLDFARIRELYVRSWSVVALNLVLFIPAFAFFLVLLYGLGTRFDSGSWIGLIAFGFLCTTIWALFIRSELGRHCGVVCCIPLCFGVPIGTLIAVAALLAFFQEPALFGAHRITHKSLKVEYRYRKKSQSRTGASR